MKVPLTDGKYSETESENEPQMDMQENEKARGMSADSEEAEAPLPGEELIPEEQEEAPKPSEIEVLQEEVALLGQQLQQMRDRYVRAVADLDNARKRARQAISEARYQAVGGVLLDLLTLLDNFERAMETVDLGPDAPPETQAVYHGVALIYRQLGEILERRGVKPIEAMGQLFDPSRHEAVTRVPVEEDQEEGTVAMEMQKGYMHGDRVLRPSRVGVAVHEAAEDT